MSRIYIIRHGETDMNNAHVLQGRSDLPLNENGMRQAREAAETIKKQGILFDYVFTSPLIRAGQTASILAPEQKAETDERLIEMDYGPYEGTDLKNLPEEIITFFSDFVNNPAPDGMEQLSSVIKRSGDFLDSIKKLQGNILVSTHAILMKGILEYLTPQSHGSYWSKYIGNCAIYMTECSDGNFSVPVEII